MRRWGMGLCAAWLSVIGASVVWSQLPGSFWFEPGDLIVEDAVAGTCPEMRFERTIKRPFHGRWLVTLQRQVAGGGFSVHRVYSGENDYRPDVVLPSHIDFAWWAWIEECDFPPGIYRVATQWTILPGGSAERYARVTSNPFRVEMP